LLAKLTQIDHNQTQGALAPISPAEKQQLNKQLVEQLKQMRSINGNGRDDTFNDTFLRAHGALRSLSQDQPTLKRIARQALLIDSLPLALQAAKHIRAGGATVVEENTTMVTDTLFLCDRLCIALAPHSPSNCVTT